MRQVGGKPIVYLDSAATALKPQCVIDAVNRCYASGFGNIGRGVHLLAEEASNLLDSSRRVVADFIGADADEIVFTHNATHAINLVASSFPVRSRVLIGLGEHHSNFLPWIANHDLVTAQIQSDATLDLADWQRNLDAQSIKVCTFGYVSNVTGAIQPAHQLIHSAHSAGAHALVDASQAVGHFPVDVKELACDFLCFSGHKMGGPTGAGVCYVRREAHSLMKPTCYGGGMVDEVSKSDFSIAKFPRSLESGTPCLEGIVGLAAACRYLAQVGLQEIHEHERRLTKLASDGLSQMDRVSVIGSEMKKRGPIVSFQLEGIEAHGVARLLSNRFNIMVRSGFHCAQPLHSELGLRPSVRCSFALYNTLQEAEQLVDAIRTICSYN